MIVQFSQPFIENPFFEQILKKWTVAKSAGDHFHIHMDLEMTGEPEFSE